MFSQLSRILLAGWAVIWAMSANGEVSSAEPGAILVFPKIIRDVDQDTIIQISNSTGSRVLLHCFYVNGAPDPNTGEPLWSVTDFHIRLTRQQPTFWVAGSGLPAVPQDGRPSDLYPGPVPPLGEGFAGELRCVVVDEGELPQSRNALTGHATLINRRSGATRKYQAIGIRGLPGNNRDSTLLFNEVEYTSCPRVLILNHFYDGAPDPIFGTPINSSLTVVPCSADVERSFPGRSTLLFETFNEFEQRLSGSLIVTCFSDTPLSTIDSRSDPTRSIFHYAIQGTLVGQTRIRPLVDAGVTSGHGILAIAEEFRSDGTIGAGINLHFIGGNLQADVLSIPGIF
jgi:hypothetical protein